MCFKYVDFVRSVYHIKKNILGAGVRDPLVGGGWYVPASEGILNPVINVLKKALSITVYNCRIHKKTILQTLLPNYTTQI